MTKIDKKKLIRLRKDRLIYNTEMRYLLAKSKAEGVDEETKEMLLKLQRTAKFYS